MNRRGRWALVLVLLLVNGAAVWGQAGWALEHIVPANWDWRAGLTLALAFAAAIELIGVFLALSADDAEDRGIPSGGIRLASYGIGIVSGALNYSHWSGAAAIAFALLSAISPFLWGINSRVNRARPIAPSRRFWHPRKSITLIRHMAWEGIALEADGIESMNTPRLIPATVISDEEAEQIVDRWTKSVSQADQAEIEAPSAAPETVVPILRAARTRAAAEEQRAAVQLILNEAGGTDTEIVADTGVSLATVRLYRAVYRELRNNPMAEIGPKFQGRSVNPELVAVIRDQANRERAL